jgi:hypothetical protein
MARTLAAAVAKATVRATPISARHRAFRPALSTAMKWSSILAVGLVVLTATQELRSQTSTPSLFEQRVTVQADRKRSLRTAGGDFDDKRDQITFNVKLTNNDGKQTFERCKAEFYVFGQSIVDRRAYKLFGVDHSEFSLAPRGAHEFTTVEVVSQYDTTGARFGARYDGWVIVVRNEKGEVIMKKGSTPTWLPVAEKLGTLRPGAFYDKTLKEMNNVQ